MLTARITGIEGLDALQAFLNPDLFDKAAKAGLAYAAKAVPPAVAKGITEQYGISSARIKQDISGVRFQDGGLTATIAFSRRPPTLLQYGAKPGSRGGPQPGLGRGKGWGKPKRPGKPVSALVARSVGRQQFPTSFIARGAQGNQLVLRRSKGKLISVYGPSIGSIFLGQSAIGDALRASVQARIQEQFEKGFQRAVDAAARGF